MKTAYLVWKIPENRDIDVGEFHDVGIYPTGELMAVCESIEDADETIRGLRRSSPSDRFGETIEDAPYQFVWTLQDVRIPVGAE